MGSVGIENEMRRPAAGSLRPVSSLEVLALHRACARLFGRTRLGDVLVAAAEEEYRRFLAEACLPLLVDGRSRTRLEAVLVRPLLRVLELAHEHLRRERASERLAEALNDDARSHRFPEMAAPEDWAQTAQMLEELVDPRRWPHLHWCVVEPLVLYASARASHRKERPAQRVLAEALEGWLGELPLDQILQQVPVDELCDDLEALATTSFTRRTVRLRLGERLRARVNASARSSFLRRLAATGYL